MNAENLGAKIRALRKRFGMTQSELCGDFITRNMLSRIETGAALPSLETLLYIANRLEISPGWLIDDDAELSGYEKERLLSAVKDLYKEKNSQSARSTSEIRPTSFSTTSFLPLRQTACTKPRFRTFMQAI